MKWGILATGTIAKKFASTVEQMGAEGEQLVAVGSRHLKSAQAFACLLYTSCINRPGTVPQKCRTERTSAERISIL